MNEEGKNSRAPTFFTSYVSYVKYTAKNAGVIAYLPIQFLSLVALPAILIHITEYRFIDKITVEEFIAVVSSLVVFIGIISAFSISSISQIQQMTSAYPFSDYLSEIGILDHFLFYPQFTFFIQSFFVIACLLSSLSIYIFEFMRKYIDYHLLILCGMCLYIVIRTLGLVNLIRLLTWHYTDYYIKFNKED